MNIIYWRPIKEIICVLKMEEEIQSTSIEQVQKSGNFSKYTIENIVNHTFKHTMVIIFQLNLLMSKTND